MSKTHYDMVHYIEGLLHIEILKNVQRRATRQIAALKGLPYEERLGGLELPMVVYRRDRGDVIETFKIIRKVYDEVCNFFVM